MALCMLLIVGIGEFVCCLRGTFQRDFKTKYAPYYMVASFLSHTLMVYTLGGQLIHEFGGYGSDPGRCSTPHGICVDDSGLLYVADYYNNHAQVF